MRSKRSEDMNRHMSLIRKSDAYPDLVEYSNDNCSFIRDVVYEAINEYQPFREWLNNQNDVDADKDPIIRINDFAREYGFIKTKMFDKIIKNFLSNHK